MTSKKGSASILLSNSESNRPLRSRRRGDQLTKGAEDLPKLLIVLAHPSFYLLQPLLDRCVRAGNATQLDECPHDLDVYGDGPIAAKDPGEHRDALLSEDKGALPATAMAAT